MAQTPVACSKCYLGNRLTYLNITRYGAAVEVIDWQSWDRCQGDSAAGPWHFMLQIVKLCV